MANKKKTTETSLKILRAANALILEQGVAHLTLEAVAQQAGVSKGGLLYHFPHKEALIKGLLNYLAQDFDQELERQLEAEPDRDKSGSWLRAYIRASFMPSQNPSNVDAGLLAAVTLNPELLVSVRQNFKDWQTQVEQDGLDPALATVIRLAADGLWLAELLELGAPNPALREQVVAKLLELSGG